VQQNDVDPLLIMLARPTPSFVKVIVSRLKYLDVIQLFLFRDRLMKISLLLACDVNSN
jgi:hypothetical protein